MAPVKGPFGLIIPVVTVMFDNRHAFTTAVVIAVPTTVPAVIVMSVFSMSTAEFTVIASIAVSIITDVNVKSLGARNGRGGYSESGHKNKSKFSHLSLHLEVPKNNGRE